MKKCTTSSIPVPHWADQYKIGKAALTGAAFFNIILADEILQGAITADGQINCDEIVTFFKKDVGGSTKLLDCMFF